MTDSWVHEGGYFGPFLLMFMVFVVYYCFMLPHKWQTLFIIINLCYAFSLGFVFPCYDVIESHDFSVFRLLLALCCCVIAIYFCASVLDYSYKKERKLALSRQQSLEEVAELQTQMLSIISHDVRAPLANVELLLTMINKGMLTQAQQADMMVKLQKSVHQSREVLESMVGWTRSQVVNTQQKTAIIVRCDVARIIEENIPDWQDFAISKGLTLDYVPAPKQAATTTIADANLVRTATRNLIMNAIKFTPEGGTITLTVAVAEPDLIISVIDTGIGIAPDRLSQLFGQRITSKVGTNGEKGSGIGLWIVNDMIKKVGGSILVTSELGKGSTFSLQMPQ